MNSNTSMFHVLRSKKKDRHFTFIAFLETLRYSAMSSLWAPAVLSAACSLTVSLLAQKLPILTRVQLWMEIVSDRKPCSAVRVRCKSPFAELGSPSRHRWGGGGCRRTPRRMWSVVSSEGLYSSPEDRQERGFSVYFMCDLMRIFSRVITHRKPRDVRVFLGWLQGGRGVNTEVCENRNSWLNFTIVNFLVKVMQTRHHSLIYSVKILHQQHNVFHLYELKYKHRCGRT